jgi:hypothetical protein
MSSLVPCASCARHVRITESVCPFCQRPFSEPARASAPLPTDSALTRAAIVFMGATALSACGKSNVPGPTPAPTDLAAPAYGPAPVDTDAGPTPVTPVEAGAPAPVDAGAPTLVDAGAGTPVPPPINPHRRAPAYGGPPKR